DRDCDHCGAEPEVSEPGVLDLRGILGAIVQGWRLVIGDALAPGRSRSGESRVGPKWYTGSATILPPEESDLLSNRSLAQKALTKFPAFGILEDYFTPADVYKAILGSRTVREELMGRFELQKVYGKKSMEQTLKALDRNTKIRMNPDGTIKVSVDDRDPRRS